MVFASPRNLIVLFALLMAVAPVQAQETADVSSDEKKQQAKDEEVEATSDLRDSIHENLETLSEDAESVEELKKTAADDLPDKQQQADTVDTSVPVIAEPGEPPAEGWSILGFFKSIPGYLQSVPDRVPFIRDRGLIFFGRTEIDYAYYSSGITKNDSGFRVRSLRAGLAKAFKHDLSLKAEVDLTDGDSNFADLYGRYRHKKYGLFTAGNQRVAQTLAP